MVTPAKEVVISAKEVVTPAREVVISAEEVVTFAQEVVTKNEAISQVVPLFSCAYGIPNGSRPLKQAFGGRKICGPCRFLSPSILPLYFYADQRSSART